MNKDVLPLLAIVVVNSIKFDGITAPGKKPSLPAFIEACGKRFFSFSIPLLMRMSLIFVMPTTNLVTEAKR